MAYRHVRLTVDGRQVRPEDLVEHTETYVVDLEGGDEPAELEVVEWKKEMDRAIYLCDMDGSVLGDVKAGVHAPAVSFTAYYRLVAFVATSTKCTV